MFVFKDNMEYLQHDYILTWTASESEPFILCLSGNKWSCGTYQKCRKEWNALLRQNSYRESTYCPNTDTERHMWDSINCAIFAEWRTQKLWSCFNFKFYKIILSTFQVNNFHVTMHTWYAFRWISNKWEYSEMISDPLPKLQISFKPWTYRNTTQ